MRKEHQNASTRSLRLIGQGREAEVFEWRDGRVLKLLRAPGPSAGLAFELRALDAARSAGVSVPQAYDEVVIDGRAGLVMERLEGSDLLTIIVNLAARVLDEVPSERPRLLQRLQKEFARGEVS
jgi:hypothetical protein